MANLKEDTNLVFEHVEMEDMLIKKLTLSTNSSNTKERMKKLIGTAYSKTTKITYQVRWDTHGGDVWIKEPNKPGWIIVAEEANSAERVLDLAHEAIDDQDMN